MDSVQIALPYAALVLAAAVLGMVSQALGNRNARAILVGGIVGIGLGLLIGQAVIALALMGVD